MTSASAPGKVILFGEHAVVYGRPALAVPVTEVHADVEVTDASRTGIWLDAAEVDLHVEVSQLPTDHPLAAAIHGVFSSLGLPHPNPSPAGSPKGVLPPSGTMREGARGERFPSLNIRVTSTIPVASGLGSGAAVSVALVRALSSHLGHPFSDERVSALAYEVEKLHHGTPSGIDNTVITYARPVYFVKGQPIETLQGGKPFTIVIGDTGIPAPTKEVVGDVRRLWQEEPQRFEHIFDAVGEIVRRARRAIEDGDVTALGPLMDENHFLLQDMAVSSPELDRLVVAAWAAGADGAKLSGGGRGGNMIALVQPDFVESVAGELQSRGAKRTIITTVGARAEV